MDWKTACKSAVRTLSEAEMGQARVYNGMDTMTF